MAKYFTVTWENMWWEDDEDSSESYDVHIGGFIVNGWREEQETEFMTVDECIAGHERAKQDLDEMIDCESCAEYLELDENNNWVSVHTKSVIGMNPYEDKHHFHKPDKLWYEIFVDVLEEYGAYEENMISYMSEYHVEDYRKGIQRQYGVHIEWDISKEEFDLIDNEIKLRAENRKRIARNFTEKVPAG
jgi:hypothetical protein